MTRLVGEHSSPHRRCVVRHAGASGKANVGISNDKRPSTSALRLRLRPRLTLIRLALIRKPWSSGVRVSHPHYRYFAYIFFSSRSKIPHDTSSALTGMLPYRSSRLRRDDPMASVCGLMPAYFPRRNARLVSCYALFK